ncbi:MAG: GNAT family N-acetyltransferase [Planctomycetota bacterium]|nr:GNAT family N-acetyltransferase [Planctomycetota bacterium]
METCCLHDKAEIEAFLRKNVYLHIYSIGDLDDFFWHNTLWYALKDGDDIQALVMLYTVPPVPTLHAMNEEKDLMAKLLRSVLHLLPGRFHAHLSPGLAEVFAKRGTVESNKKHYKMALNDRSHFQTIDCSQVVRLTADDLDEMLRLYEEAYPGNWFNPRMLETGQYFGIRKENRLVSVAGVHVYSQEYKVASLGNVVTHPDHRNNGYAKAATTRLCQSLTESTDHIGLNVKAGNAAALSLYEKLGFEIISPYYECMISTHGCFGAGS